MDVEVGTYVDENGGWLGTNTNHPLLFYTNNGAQQLILTPSGNFGIGALVPSKRLHVLGDIQMGSTNVWASPADNSSINFGDLNFCYVGEVGADDRMELRAGFFYFNNGNVGIGTASPIVKLDVVGAIRSTNFQMLFGAGAGKILQSDASGYASCVSNGHTIGESFGGGIVFYVYDNGKHGLIAAPSDQHAGIPTHHAKYFAKSTREDGLVSLATHGIVFAPGAAGTVQEIFQDACQNHYGTVRGEVAPMVLFDEGFWRKQMPVMPALEALATRGKWTDRLLVTDDPERVLSFLEAVGPRHRCSAPRGRSARRSVNRRESMRAPRCRERRLVAQRGVAGWSSSAVVARVPRELGPKSADDSSLRSAQFVPIDDRHAP